MKALDVSKYIIAKCDDVGELITNKKLQKLLYYVKAWGLVYFAEGVIEEQFEAWVHGPVCRDVYKEYKDYGYQPVHVSSETNAKDVILWFQTKHQDEADKVEMIDAVIDKYAPISALQLELLTHSEQPWIEARADSAPMDMCNNIINEKTMRNYYDSKLENAEA